MGDHAPMFDRATIQRLFTHSPHGVQLTDRAGRIEYTNHAGTYLLRRSTLS